MSKDKQPQRKPPGVTWESFAEHQIREAQEEGKFDDLPGFGKPLPDIDPHDDMWWLKKKAQEEQFSLLPPALQIRIDVEQTLQGVWKLPSESEVRAAIEALNQRILRANFAITWGPPSSTVPLDIESVIADWRSRAKSP